MPPIEHVPNCIPSPSFLPSPRLIFPLADDSAVAIPLTECTSWNAASWRRRAANHLFLKQSAARWLTTRKKKFCRPAAAKATAPRAMNVTAMSVTFPIPSETLLRSEKESEKT